MAIANPPTLSNLITKEGRITFDWESWFRAIWQRINEPWKYDSERSGTATLSSGVIVIANARVQAASKIHMTAQTASANAGFLSVAIVAGTSITITSSNASDDRVIFWEIRESL